MTFQQFAAFWYEWLIQGFPTCGLLCGCMGCSGECVVAWAVVVSVWSHGLYNGECVVAWAVVMSVWFYGMYNDACGVLVSRHTHRPPSSAKVGKGGKTSGELGMVLATCTGAASLSLSLLVQWAVWSCKWRASLVGWCLPVLHSSLSLSSV